MSKLASVPFLAALSFTGLFASSALADPVAGVDPASLPALGAAGSDDGVAAPEPRAFRFRCDAIYAGAGAGAIAPEHVGTFDARIQAVLAVTDWAMIEGNLLGVGFSAVDHHGVSDTSAGFGFGVGLRVAPSASWRVRPYGAVRVSHLHLSPDPWGEHAHAGTSSVSDHVSQHRFGAALATGFDFGLLGPDSRLRLGFDAEATALSGTGANLLLQGVAMLGVAL